MTDRGLSAAAITELGSSSVEFYYLLKINFSPVGTDLFYTTAPYDIDYDGDTYLSNFIINNIPDMVESLKIKPSSNDLKLSGASLSVHALGNISFRHAEVKTFRHILNVSGSTETVLMYKGFIDSYSSTENVKSGKSNFTFKIANHWTDWESTSGRLLTTENQEDLFTGDLGLEFVAVTEPVIGFWGKHDFQRLDVFIENRRAMYAASPGYYELHIEPYLEIFDSYDAVGEFDWGANNGSAAKLPIVYGKAPVIGTPVFRDTSGTNGEFLWVVYTLAEGECDSIDDILFDDVSYTDVSLSSYLDVTFHSGNDAQVADAPLVASAGSWTTNHRLRGICYVIIKYTYNTEVWNGEPQPKFILNGKKCVPIGGGAAAWTTDPATILHDYLTNSTYGKGLVSADLDDFAAGSAYCTATETDHDNGLGGGTSSIAHFDFNGILSTSQSMKKNTEVILNSMIGHLPWVSGKYKLVIERNDDTSVFLFDDNNIKGEFTIKDGGIKQRANEVYYTYLNPSLDYTEATEFTKLSNTIITNEDNGRSIRKNIKNKYETNKYRAKNRSNTILKVSRNNLTNELTCYDAAALKIETGNVVSVTRETSAWVAKLFRVREMKMLNNGDCKFTLREYDATNYDWAVNAEKSEPTRLILTNPLSVSPPTGLVLLAGVSEQMTTDDLAEINRIKISFTAPVNVYEVDHYEVEYKESSDTDYVKTGNLVGRENTTTYINNVSYNITYNIRVYTVNGLGVRSTALTGSVTPSETGKAGYDDRFIGLDAWGNDDNDVFMFNWANINDYFTLGDISIANGLVIVDDTHATELGQITGFRSSSNVDTRKFGNSMKLKTKAEIQTASLLDVVYIFLGVVYGFNSVGIKMVWNSGTGMIDMSGFYCEGFNITDGSVFASIATDTEFDVLIEYNLALNAVFTINTNIQTLAPSTLLDVGYQLDGRLLSFVNGIAGTGSSLVCRKSMTVIR